jgi:hypothetical protein
MFLFYSITDKPCKKQLTRKCGSEKGCFTVLSADCPKVLSVPVPRKKVAQNLIEIELLWWFLVRSTSWLYSLFNNLNKTHAYVEPSFMAAAGLFDACYLRISWPLLDQNGLHGTFLCQKARILFWIRKYFSLSGYMVASFISCEALNFCFHLIYIFKYPFTFTPLVHPAVKWKLPSSLKEDPVVWGFITALRDTLHMVGNPLAGLAVQASHKSQIVLQQGFSKRDWGEQTAQKKKNIFILKQNNDWMCYEEEKDIFIETKITIECVTLQNTYGVNPDFKFTKKFPDEYLK